MHRLSSYHLAFGLLFLVACKSPRPYTCSLDGQCVVGGLVGRCAESACAFPAGDCASGYRFHESAGDRAGQCVSSLAPDMAMTTLPDMSTSLDAGDGSVGDGGQVPTCANQTFGTPMLVSTSQISGALETTMWGVRVVGPNAYFGAIPKGGTEQQIFRATYTAGASPSLSNAAVLTPPSSASVIEWSPAVSADSALMVFATGYPPPRELSFSIGSGGGFGAPTALASLNTAADETDPWLVGKPAATVLYFGRENASTDMEIWRSPISAGPTFATPTKVTLVCPQSDCGTPVVIPDETMIFYASWANGGFVPNVQEGKLTVAGAAATAGPALGHPELGNRYPAWISDDGCEVLLGGGNISTISDMYYARRQAK